MVGSVNEHHERFFTSSHKRIRRRNSTSRSAKVTSRKTTEKNTDLCTTETLAPCCRWSASGSALGIFGWSMEPKSITLWIIKGDSLEHQCSHLWDSFWIVNDNDNNHLYSQLHVNKALTKMN